MRGVASDGSTARHCPVASRLPRKVSRGEARRDEVEQKVTKEEQGQLMYKFMPQAHPRKGESTTTIFAFKGWVLDIFFCGFSNVETKSEAIDQVFFKRYRNTALVKHLGNLLRAIRIQNLICLLYTSDAADE